MKLSRYIAVAVVAACLPAHAAKQTPPPAPSYNFDYQVAGADAVGIKRVFDDGKNTVLILDTSGPLPTVTKPDGTPLSIKRVENYAVLPGLQADVLVYSKGTVAHVVEGRPATPVVVAAKQAAPAATVAVQTVATPAPNLGKPGAATLGVACAPNGLEANPTGGNMLICKNGVWAGLDGKAASVAALATTSPAAATPTKVTVTTPVPEAWTASAGDQLQAVIKAWAARVQWTVVWVPKDVNYRLAAPLHFEGDVIAAMQQVFKLYSPGEHPLRPDFYPTQRLVVITEAR